MAVPGQRPLIAITVDSEDPGGYSKFPWYALRENYTGVVVKAGGIPLILPNESALVDDYAALVDGLIITGGAFDVSPALYGEGTAHDTVILKENRTAFELGITRKALEKDIPVLGICGGFQMLGERIEDPDGLEGDPGGDDGLGWLALRTTLVRGKQLRNVSGTLLPDGVPIHGYEIHNGVSDGAALGRPLLHLDGRADGALSDDDRLRGTYLHGLFDDPGATDALLRWAGLADSAAAIDYHHHRQHDLDRLANAIDQHLDTGALLALLNPM